MSTRGRPFLPTRTRTSTTVTPTSTPVIESSTVPSRKSPEPAELPATVRETVARRPIIGLSKSPSPPTILTEDNSDHPQDNEISGSGVDNAQAKIGTGVPEPSGPFRVDRSDSPVHQAKFSTAAWITLAVIGSIVIVAAVTFSVVAVIRR